LMGIGQASGENRAIEAAKAAISSPLLEISIEGARGILFTVVGGANLSMNEVNEAAKIITASADDDAKIIFGAVIDEKMKDEIKVTVVATGFEGRLREADRISERMYTPNAFIAEEEKKSQTAHEKMAEIAKKKNKFSSFKAAQAEPAQKKSAAQNEDDDEIGIPAFIRKKMM